MSEIYNRLAEPFAPEMERTLNKGGTRLTYIPVSEVITRLNRVFGVGGWSSQIVSCKRDDLDPDYIVASVTLSARVADSDDVTGGWISHDGIGGQKIKRTKNGDIVDLGDEMKGAVSDALKKAAQSSALVYTSLEMLMRLRWRWRSTPSRNRSASLTNSTSGL